MKKLSYKAGLLPDYFYMPWALHYSGPLQNNELHLIFSWPIYYCSRIRFLETAANPFVTVLGPESSGHSA